jgi:formiminoglutamase
MRRPAVRADWSGRSDADDGERARRWHQVVRPCDVAGARVSLLGFACDTGVTRNLGRAGAAAGPMALRKALANVPVHRLERIDDLGNVSCDGDALEQAQADYGEVVTAAVAAGSLPIGFGGGHEIAFASYLGLSGAVPPGESVGIVNFDAHFDLRGGERASSGTPFRQILEHAAGSGRRAEYLCLGVSRFANTAALFDRARALGVRWVEDEDVHAGRLEALRGEIEGLVRRVDHLYLTVCLDVFPASVAPGVSAPAALGVDPGVVERLVDAAVATGKLRTADVAELNPRHDIDARTARLAARLVARIAEGAVQAAG